MTMFRRHEDCTCPIGLHANDPDNAWCAHCERRMDEDAEREEAEAFEEFHALAFEALTVPPDGEGEDGR